MLKRDYILKLIEQLARALASVTQADGPLEQRRRELQSLYALFGDEEPAFYRTSTVQETLEALADPELSDTQFLQKAEAMADLLKADGNLTALAPNGSLEQAVLLRRKALEIYEYVDARSADFSLPRVNAIAELRKSFPL